MTAEGPVLDRLTHRLSECPQDLLDQPLIRGRGTIHVDAVVNDLVLDLGGTPVSGNVLKLFRPSTTGELNHMRLVMVACWLLHDPWFVRKKSFAESALTWLGGGLRDVAGLVRSDLFVTDPDRREELARLCLTALGLRPKGESEAHAEDRLRTLDSVERAQVIVAMREKQERARKLREKMEAERAREAAAKASREW